MTDPETETPGQVIAQLTVSATGAASDSEGHPLDAAGNRVEEKEES